MTQTYVGTSVAPSTSYKFGVAIDIYLILLEDSMKTVK